MPACRRKRPSRYLYEPKYGLPVVREYLRYEELLKMIRLEQVEEILFFQAEETVELEGPCLVVYRCCPPMLIPSLLLQGPPRPTS